MFDSVASITLAPWAYYSLMAVYSLTVILILVVIQSENRHPVKSLAWVTVIMLLPAVGVVLYLFFGRSIKNKRMISRRNRRRLKRVERYRSVDMSKQDISDLSRQEVALSGSLARTLYYPGNDIKIFTNGTAKFASLLADIAEAKEYINVQYYIFDNDGIGRRVADALMERARAGVEVRVIYDHVGSLRTPNRFFREMSEAGVKVYPFFRVNFPSFATRVNWRNHRKLCVIDGRVGYVGGMNIADRYMDGGKTFQSWRDTHLRVTGPAVAALQYSFAVDWNFMGQPLIEDAVADTRTGSMGAQLVTSGPTSQWSNIEFMFVRAIAGARKRIFIQTPYFVPSDALLKAVQTAALARVDVRVLMPRRSDSRMLTFASFSYIAECLRAGVKIYLYDAGMLHSKMLLIDDDITSVGSANFDFRSFEHNFEANLFVYSQEFNRRMADIFMADLKHSTRVMASQWGKRPAAQKAAESVLRLLSPVL